MKASEIFLEYAAPVREGLPQDVSAVQLKRVLMVPELVWNCVVLDKNEKRKPGQLPPRLLQSIEKDFPPRMRNQARQFLTFWVLRKDTEYSQHRWPMVTEIYENLKKEIIVRVLVHGAEELKNELPKEWMQKSPGTIHQLIKDP